MRLVFLGTSASEAFPNAFCDCDNCEAARAAGGRSLRKRSAALLDGELLIDLGPDLMAAAQQHGLSLARINYCLQTHEHHDHLDLSHFLSRSQYCKVYGTPRLHYYAAQSALEKLGGHVAGRFGKTGAPDPEVEDALNLRVRPVEIGQEFAVGPYTVLPVRANHARHFDCMLFVIARAGRTLFYCTDTGELPDATWDALARYVQADGTRAFNLVVMDHTAGLRPSPSDTHMNQTQFLAQMARMRELGLLADDARVYATHIAHHGNPVHEELEANAAQHGYQIAYDGLALDV